MPAADIDEICRLKYRYMRGVDTQDVELIGSCLCEDVSVSFDGGSLEASGRDSVLELVGGALAPGFYSSHIAVHPEIEVDGDRAAGIWKLQTVAQWAEAEKQSRNAGYFSDEYVREGGGWLISRSAYKLVFKAELGWDGRSPMTVETFAGRGV